MDIGVGRECERGGEGGGGETECMFKSHVTTEDMPVVALAMPESSTHFCHRQMYGGQINFIQFAFLLEVGRVGKQHSNCIYYSGDE